MSVSSSYTKQLWMATLGLVLATLLIVWGISQRAMNQLVSTSVEARLKDQIRSLTYRLNAEWPGVDNPAALQTFCQTWGQEMGYRITLIQPNGTILADSRKDPKFMDNHTDRPEIKTALTSGWGFSTRYSYTLRQPLVYGAHLAMIHDQPIVLRLSLPQGEQKNIFRHFNTQFLWVSLILLALAAVISIGMNRRLTGALSTLKHHVQRYTGEDVTPALISPGIRELTELTVILDQMALDFTQHIQTLRTEKDELEAVLRGMVEGVVALDASHRILRMNQAARNLLQPILEDVEGYPLSEVVRNTSLIDFLGTATLDETELQVGSPPRVLQVRRTRITSHHENALAYILVIYDLTQIRSLEKVRQEFVANVSHELKTPITTIKGFAETLLDDVLSPETQTQFIRTILRHADRMNALIEDLLELSRLDNEAPDTELAGDAIILQDLLDNAVQECASRAESRHIRIVLNCSSELKVRGNERLLHRAWVNLLDNAIKYSPRDGIVTLTAQKENRHLRITIEDQGPGIPPEHRDRIFERFYRVDPGRDREKGGTGLGLSIVKHIIRIHRGSIAVSERPEGGSRFTIELPSADT